jgi:two-component system, NarL family, invasion response regulator UvrY
MPGRSGLEVLKELQVQRPKLPVLILSMYPERQYAVRALRSGASGYLTKASAATESMQAVKKILEGGRYVSASLAEKMASELARPTGGPPHVKPPDREYEVLCLIGTGKTVSEIAAELKLSVNAVSTHRARASGVGRRG